MSCLPADCCLLHCPVALLMSGDLHASLPHNGLRNLWASINDIHPGVPVLGALAANVGEPQHVRKDARLRGTDVAANDHIGRPRRTIVVHTVHPNVLLAIVCAENRGFFG